jgi:hypothetical protein
MSFSLYSVRYKLKFFLHGFTLYGTEYKRNELYLILSISGMILSLYYRLPLDKGIYLQLKQLGVHKKCYIRETKQVLVLLMNRKKSEKQKIIVHICRFCIFLTIQVPGLHLENFSMTIFSTHLAFIFRNLLSFLLL